MTCNVSRYVRQTGYPLDCYCAIEFLYSSSFPACVICRSCLVQPLDGNERPYGGQRDKDGQPIAPALGQTTMNSAYDAALSGEGYGGKPLCDGYSLPPNVELDPNYHYTPGLIFPTFLLGLKVGQPEVAMECTPELAKKAFKEAMWGSQIPQLMFFVTLLRYVCVSLWYHGALSKHLLHPNDPFSSLALLSLCGNFPNSDDACSSYYVDYNCCRVIWEVRKLLSSQTISRF